MNRIFIAGTFLAALAASVQPSTAADMPARVVKAPVSAAAPLFNWTGFYVGAQGGYGWGETRHIDVGGGPAITDRFDFDGWIGGATVGVNWQGASPWVFGLEADYSWGTISASDRDDGTSSAFTCTCRTEVQEFGTARVRLGYAIGQSLPYATGGIAYGKIFAFDEALRPSKETRRGWTLGAGIEHAFAANWSGKLEYLYVDLGEFEYHPSGPYRTEARFHVVRAGINYRFATGKAPAPVVTKY